MANNTKFLSENQSLEGSLLLDKFFVMTKTNGDDSKASFNAVALKLEQHLAKRDFINHLVGQTYKNVNNKYRDQLKIRRGYYELLLANGQTVNTADYPDLAREYAETGSTFKLPNFQGAYCKESKVGSGNALMQFLTGAFLKHSHTINHDHDMTHAHPMPHDHDMAHDHPAPPYGKDKSDTNGSYDLLTPWDSGPDGTSNKRTGASSRNKTGGSSNANTGASSRARTGGMNTTNSGESGADENDCNRVYVQHYIYAKCYDAL